MKNISRTLKNNRGCLSDGQILTFGLIGVPLYLGVKAVIYGMFVWAASNKILKTPLTQKRSFGFGLGRAIVGVVFSLPLIPLATQFEKSTFIPHATINLISAVPAWTLICVLIRVNPKPENKQGFLLFVLLGSSLSFIINHFIFANFR
jgi:hypothetical protein